MISMPHVLIQMAHTPAHVMMVMKILKAVSVARTTALISMNASEELMSATPSTVCVLMVSVPTPVNVMLVGLTPQLLVWAREVAETGMSV